MTLKLSRLSLRPLNYFLTPIALILSTSYSNDPWVYGYKCYLSPKVNILATKYAIALKVYFNCIFRCYAHF